MEEIILSIFLILLIIILCLLCYILYPPKVRFENSPDEVSVVKAKQSSSSIVGASSAVMLKPIPKTKTPVVPKEELKKVFENETYNDEDIDHEYDDETSDDEVTTEDPIYLEDEVIQSMNNELQKKVCLDYFQVESASRAVAKGGDFTEDNKDTIRKLRGTELLSKVLEQMNGKYSDSASDLIDKLGLI